MKPGHALSRKITRFFPQAFRWMALPILSAAVSLSACTTSSPVGPTRTIPTQSSDPNYGISESTPIRVGGGLDYGPQREVWYLERLRGPDGQRVKYERTGACCEYDLETSVTGQGRLDIYEVTYPGLQSPTRLYLDIYQCEAPGAPSGFLLETSESGVSGVSGSLFFASHSQILAEVLANSIYLYDVQTQCLTQQPSAGISYAPFDVFSGGSRLVGGVVAADGISTLFFADFADQSTRPLTTGSVWDTMPDLSPDEDKVVFVRQSGDNLDILRVPISGGSPIQLTDGAFADLEPAWSPDGTLIAFSSDRDGDFELYLMEKHGNNVRQLTDDPASDVSPAWSPDGDQLVFVSDRSGEIDLYRMDIASGNTHRISTPGIDDAFPSWAPAARIAFCGSDGDGSAIYMVDAEGSQLKKLTEASAASACYPEWSQ